MDIQKVSWERFKEIVKSADQILVTSDKFVCEEEEYRFWTFLNHFSDDTELQFMATDNDEFFIVEKQELSWDGTYFSCKCGDSIFKMKFNRVMTTSIIP
ncbi:MAG: hypothetical protein M0P12_00545 [Paludibacteraceae bacterium]|jgi:hypothetical protein|nr:hypothetical protein [Paludibacteraceae bacterium]MCK9615811.1 hypothetical protein [Candidatus Omnitrophota bacterium]